MAINMKAFSAVVVAAALVMGSAQAEAAISMASSHAAVAVAHVATSAATASMARATAPHAKTTVAKAEKTSAPEQSTAQPRPAASEAKADGMNGGLLPGGAGALGTLAGLAGLGVLGMKLGRNLAAKTANGVPGENSDSAKENPAEVDVRGISMSGFNGIEERRAEMLAEKMRRQASTPKMSERKLV